jgi:anti-anti-sigma factor
METTTQQTGDVRMLHLNGRLTADRHDERLPDLVRRMVGQGARLLVLDLRSVSYMDSTCLGEFIQAHRSMGRCGGHLVLINVPPRVQRLLKLSRLTNVLIDPPGPATGRCARGSAA